MLKNLSQIFLIIKYFIKKIEVWKYDLKKNHWVPTKIWKPIFLKNCEIKQIVKINKNVEFALKNSNMNLKFEIRKIIFF